MAPRQPSLFGQMAATAGGVAVGSVVGHTIGQAITGSGRSYNDYPPEVKQYAESGTEPTGPCAWELKQFLNCASSQADLTVCDGFNEAIRNCKARNNITP